MNRKCYFLNVASAAVAVCAYLLPNGGIADQDGGQPVELETTARVAQEEITGSHLKRDVVQGRQRADAPFPVVVVDRDDIERSGVSTLQEFLTQQPFIK